MPLRFVGLIRNKYGISTSAQKSDRDQRTGGRTDGQKASFVKKSRNRKKSITLRAFLYTKQDYCLFLATAPDRQNGQQPEVAGSAEGLPGRGEVAQSTGKHRGSVQSNGHR